MELQIYLTFVVATTIMIALPGPSLLLLISHSIAFGWKRALVTVAGETMGIAVQLIIAAIGLTSLLNFVAGALNWLRWAGTAYLVYLGIKQWLGASKSIELDTSSAPKTNLFVQGLVITIFNPKSLIFIAAFLPQFINTARPLGLQFIIIVPTFLVITYIVASAWALAAGQAREFLKNQRVFQLVLRSTGGLMIIAGVGLVVAHPGS